MANPTPRKDQPLSMRMAAADIAVIDRAARLRGSSRTDFVREAAVRAAEDVLMDVGMIRMSAEGFAEFMDIINAPPKPNAALAELLARPAPWDTPPEADEKAG